MIYIDEYGNFFDAKNLTEEENKKLAKMLRERAKKEDERDIENNKNFD